MKEVIPITMILVTIIVILIFALKSSFPQEYEYKGHKFIIFFHGAVHDPDCECGKYD